MNIVDLFARIGLKTDEAKAKSFARSMNTVKVGMIATVTAATGVSLAIKKITEDALNSAVAFKQFETETGASAQELQKWQSVMEQTNQPIENVTAAVKALASNREKIKLGQGDISGYQLLGIDPNQDPFEILEQLRTKTQGLNQAMKKDVLSKFGVGSGMLQALELTNEEFTKMADRAFIISPQSIETLNKAKSSISLAGRAVSYMKAQIAVGLAPQITELTKKTTEFIKKNEDGIIKGFQVAFKWVSKFSGAIINTVTWIDNLITKTVGWKVGIAGVIGAIALLNASLLLSPIGLMTAGLLLLIAVMDDLYVYSQGGKSLFGNFVGQFESLDKLLKGILSGDSLAIDGVLDSWGAWGDIIQKIVEGLEKIKEWEERTGTIKDVVQKTKDAIIPTTEGNKRLEDRIAAQQAKDAEIKDMGTKEYLGYLKDSFLNMIGKGDKTTTNNINMTVNGSGSAEETAMATFRMLEDQINASSSQMSRDE